MLTVHGQQHSFLTHERMFLWKCQSLWDRKCLDLRGTRTPNLPIHVKCSSLSCNTSHDIWTERHIDWLIDWSINCLLDWIKHDFWHRKHVYNTHTHTLTNLCRKRLQISSHNNPKPYHWNKAPCFSNMSARWKSKISTDEIPFSINPQESQTKWPNAI